ncbi:MAG: M48 family metalloprotease [Microbacteriaceae bacterium]|jgi:heat shock protein HtpX|nr:M48 family metalloprotease [Microbacteriaceae bacterium]MBT5247566.1 M48 family metalloprotease [Microbacteriaceae bacterium]MBT5730075.1 M48 family metalloprotease [Microbacteriaceae bacterium]MBT7803421.1 M48 family metalloprotease [Microbacteriaceae bacterium]
MYRAIGANKRNTWIIMVFFIILIGALGYAADLYLSGGTGVVFFAVLIGATIYVAIQYYSSGSQALSMAGAHQIDKADNPRLYRIVENLAITTGMPMPKVYLVDDPAPNAFATGRDPDHAAVAATTGLLEIMTDSELEGVMAHEMAHVKNFDIRVTTIVFGLVVVVGIIADVLARMAFFGGMRRNNGGGNPLIIVIGIAAMILAPVLAALIQAAVSRQREYLADATGALTTRHPEALASALEKLAEYGRPLKKQQASMAHLWMADPIKPGVIDRMFQTHPPIEDRVARLLENQARF